MKHPILVLVSMFAAASAYAQPELEGREGLAFKCRQTPENTDSFCACLAGRAVEELSRDARGFLYMEWGHPTPFNFRGPSEEHELSDMDERMWGPWQRRAVPACNASSR